MTMLLYLRLQNLTILSMRSLLTLVLVATLVSCIEEIPVDVDRIEPVLVVEGSINNLDNSFVVRLSAATTFDGVSSDGSLGKDARVFIREVDGPMVELTNSGRGRYNTAPGQILGVIGRSYVLEIRLANGEVYESDVQTIPEPITILDSEVTFEEKTVLSETDVELIRLVHDVDILMENDGQPQYFKIDNRSWRKVEIAYGDCEVTAGPTQCWAYQNPIIRNEIVIGDNLDFGDTDYWRAAVSIPFDFKREYIAFLRTNAMSADNYIYWNKLQDQLNREGSIFDAPFAPIVGNIMQSNGNKIAFGYFHAFGANEFISCFDRSDVIASVSIPRVACLVACTDYWAPATFEDVSPNFCP